MQIQQKVPQQSIDSIMKDPKKYRKMILIIQQTLYDMGYAQSAKMLEDESGVCYLSQDLCEIRNHLSKDDYEAAISVIQRQQPRSQDNKPMIQSENQSIELETQSSKLPAIPVAQTKGMIFQNYCMAKILNHEYEQAMAIISQNIKNESKRESLCEALVLGNHHVTKQDIERKKQEIFRFCLSEFQQIGQRQIEKVIESYTQHQGQNNKELKKFLSSNKRLPPMKLLASECSQYIKHQITHMRFNSSTSQVVLVEEGRDYQQILVMSYSQKNWQYQKQLSQSGQLSLKLKYPIFSPIYNREVSFMYKGKRQSIQSLAFSHCSDNPLTAIGSYSIIQLYNNKMDLITSIQAENKIEKFICMQFHPVSDLLYCGGYFEAMQITDSTGQQVASIYPFPKTRKFLFYHNQIISISLVANKVSKHSADEQVLVKQRQLDQNAIPMDLCLNDKQDKLVVSSLQYLYLIDPQNMNIMGKTISPLNPHKLIIETKFYGELLITLAKTFTCYQLTIDKSIESPKSYMISKLKEWTGEGTFDINDQLMISGAKQILCWHQPHPDSLIDQQSDFEQELNDHLGRDMEVQEQQGGNPMDDSDFEESNQDEDENSDQDSMDEQEDQQDMSI